jgi:hypothetical protein
MRGLKLRNAMFFMCATIVADVKIRAEPPNVIEV